MHMKTHLTRGLITLMTVMLATQSPLASAEIVGTDQLLAPLDRTAQERAKVESFIERANVMERMQAMGLSGVVAKDRVDALSQQEVHALAQRIDTLPAGGNLSDMELILIVLIAILVAIAI